MDLCAALLWTLSSLDKATNMHHFSVSTLITLSDVNHFL